MKELAKAKLEMASLKQQHQRLYNKLQQYSIFNKYLEKVVEISEVRTEDRLLGKETKSQDFSEQQIFTS